MVQSEDTIRVPFRTMAWRSVMHRYFGVATTGVSRLKKRRCKLLKEVKQQYESPHTHTHMLLFNMIGGQHYHQNPSLVSQPLESTDVRLCRSGVLLTVDLFSFPSIFLFNEMHQCEWRSQCYGHLFRILLVMHFEQNVLLFHHFVICYSTSLAYL